MPYSKNRTQRWEVLKLQRKNDSVLNYLPSLSQDEPSIRTKPFRKYPLDQDRKERALRKATLNRVANVAVVAEQQAVVLQTRAIAAPVNRLQERAVSSDEQQPGLTCEQAYKRIKELKLKIEGKTPSWAYWQWLWHTWLGNPMDVLVSAKVHPSQKDAAFYLGGDPELQKILSDIDVEQEEECVHFIALNFRRHSPEIRRITEAALLQLIAHSKYFQFGLDFQPSHMSPGFYLEQNKHPYGLYQDELCLKYSAAKAEQPPKMHAMVLPKPEQPVLELSPDLKQKIHAARAQGDKRHDLELLISDHVNCTLLLQELKTQVGFSEEHLSALVPVYNMYGQEGLLQLLQELNELREQNFELFKQVKKYSIDFKSNLLHLLSPQYLNAIQTLRNLEPKAVHIWASLLDSHMQSQEDDNFISLAINFIDFAKKISDWQLKWPEKTKTEQLTNIPNLPIALGRGISILTACLPVDRQAQMDCLFNLDLGPTGAVMALDQGKKGFHFISDKALINSAHCDNTGSDGPKDSLLVQRLRPSGFRPEGDQQIHCSLIQNGITQSLYHTHKDLNVFKMHIDRFLGGQYYRPSLDFFNTACPDYALPEEVCILAAATSGIHKVRYANLELWHALLKLLRKSEISASWVSEWYQPPATETYLGSRKIKTFPYDFWETPSLPELIQLIEIKIRLGQLSFQDSLLERLSVTALKEAFYLSFKDYNEQDFLKNPKLFHSQINLIEQLKEETFGHSHLMPYLEYSYNPNNLGYFEREQKAELATDIQFIQKGLIKILSTFNINQSNIAEVIQALSQAINNKGTKEIREALNYLVKITAFKPKEKLHVQDLIPFINDFSNKADTELADLLIEHFPNQFNEHHFIRIQAGIGAIYSSLPETIQSDLDEWTPDLKELILEFWCTQNKNGLKNLDQAEVLNFLYYAKELQKTIAREASFKVFLGTLLRTEALIQLKQREVNQFIAVLASQGIQLCTYILQECAERKVPFNKSWVELLHGPLLPYLSLTPDKSVPPLIALQLITECFFSAKSSVSETWIIHVLEKAKGFFVKEGMRVKHKLSQELHTQILHKAIALPGLTQFQVIELIQHMNVLLKPLPPEVTYRLCYQFKEAPSEFYTLLNRISQFDPLNQLLLLGLLDKWTQKTPALELTPDFIAFVNTHGITLSQKSKEVRAIYNKAPYPSLTDLNEWLDNNESLSKQYQQFSKVPANYNQFNLTRANEQAKGILKLKGESLNALAEEDLQTLKQALDSSINKDSVALLETYRQLRMQLGNLKQNNGNPIDLFQARTQLLGLIAALLYVSTKPKPITLNETQLTALLFWLKQDCSIALGVETGEGKSRLSMVASALFATEGKTVDFITSNHALAARDFTGFHAFFELLDIPVSLITANSPFNSYKKKGINITDGRSIRLVRGQALLEGSEALELITVAPEERAGMIDEYDDLAFDQVFDRCQVSRPLPRFINRDISWICENAVLYVRSIKQQLKENEVFSAEDIDLNYAEEIELFKEYLLNKTTHYKDFLSLQASYGADSEKFKEQISLWLKAALNVLELDEGVDFEIQSGRLRQTQRGEFLKASDAYVVVNGRVDRDSRWGAWIHPCLEARLNIEREEKINRGEPVAYDVFEVGTEQRILESSTPYDLFKYYQKGRLFCMSGTPGAPLENAEVHACYQMPIFSVPRHQANRRIDLPTRFTLNHADQQRVLKEYIEQANAFGRPVLVFCKNKSEALLLAQYLKDECSDDILGSKNEDGTYEHLQLITAEMSGTPLEAERIKRAGQKGMITISTEMVGRGTDIQIDDKYPLEALGTFLSPIRPHFQMAGRPGRYGQLGFFRLVLNEEELPQELLSNNRFFYSRAAFLNQFQEQMSTGISQARLLDHCRSELVVDMTRFFFRQLHNQPQANVENLVEYWGELLEQFESEWASHRTSFANLQTITEMQNELASFFSTIEQKYWDPFLTRCSSSGFLNEQAPVHFEGYAAHLIPKPSETEVTKHKRLPIYDVYDSALDGTTVIYDSLFAETIASLTGKRAWFANTRAWLRDPQSATLFADLRAVLKGERELFANLRAYIAKILCYFKFNELADRIMPDYSKRLVRISEHQAPTHSVAKQGIFGHAPDRNNLRQDEVAYRSSLAT